MCGCLSHTPDWGLAHNPGMCPEWESNWQPFGSQASAQSTEPHQPGQNSYSLLYSYCMLGYFLNFIFIFDFRERGREREGEEEKHQCERETLIACLLQAPQLGTEPETQACALTRNQSATFWFEGRRLGQPTEPHRLGHVLAFL